MKSEIKIDGETLYFQEGTGLTIAMIAENAGIYIPKLCNCEDLHIRGNCRICMVEVLGQDRLTPACSTLAEDGLAVETKSSLAISYRRAVVEMILADHNRNCPSCSGNKECHLQRIADDLDIVREDFEEVFSPRQSEVVPGVMTINRDRCIKCGRCKAFCSERLKIGAIGHFNRGWDSEYKIHFDSGSKYSCTLCGRCTEICPVGCLNRDSQLDRLWCAVDGEKTVVAIFFDENMESLERQLQEVCGCEKEQLCRFLKKIGIPWVLWADHFPVTADSKKTELAVELAAYGAKYTGCKDVSIIGITSDIGYKYLVENPKTKSLMQALLVPKDVKLLMKQALFTI